MLTPCPVAPLLRAACTALLVLLCCPAAAEDEAWPLLDEATELSVVAGELRVDGRPMRIRSFRFDRPHDEVLNSYRNWAGAERVENRLGTWQIISHWQQRRLLMLRLRPEGPRGCTGTLSVAEPDRSGAVRGQLPEGLTMPAGTRVGPQIAMKDGERLSEVLVLDNTHPVSLNVRYFRTQLEARGYRLQHELRTEGLHPAYSLWLAAPGREAVLIVFVQARTGSTEPASTAVTLNLVRHATHRK